MPYARRAAPAQVYFPRAISSTTCRLKASLYRTLVPFTFGSPPESDNLFQDGTYRTAFDLPYPPAGQVTLQFGAVDEACQVWLNGQKALDRPYPFEGDRDSWMKPFEADVTQALSPSGRNVLAVRVESRAGDGGIWRPVWLQEHDAPVPAAANLLPNGDFSQKDACWRHDVRSGRFEFAYDTSVRRSGTAAARLTCVARDDVEPAPRTGRAWGRWYQTGLSVEPHATYRFSVWVRTDEAFGGEVGIWIRGSRTPRDARVLNTQGLWRKVVIEDIASPSGRLSVYLNSRSGLGSIWFGDAVLIEQSAHTFQSRKGASRLNRRRTVNGEEYGTQTKA